MDDRNNREESNVYAVDIAPTFLRHIEKTCTEGKIKNVETILCDQFSTKLPKNSVDLVFICDTHHHFEFPQRTLLGKPKPQDLAKIYQGFRAFRQNVG